MGFLDGLRALWEPDEITFERAATLPDEDENTPWARAQRGAGTKAPWQAPTIFSGTWINQFGAEVTATIRTNRPRTHWWYTERLANAPDFDHVRADTSSVTIAQGWADGIAAMSGTDPIVVRKGRR